MLNSAIRNAWQYPRLKSNGKCEFTLVCAHPTEDALVVEYRNVVVGDQKSNPFKVEFKRKED